MARLRLTAVVGLLAGAVLTGLAGPIASPVVAQECNVAPGWVGTWATANVPEVPSATNRIADQTLRQIVRVSVGGNAVRVRFANTFGTAPLGIAAAHVALRSAGAAIVAGSGRVLTFGGNPSIALAPGTTVVSDAVDLQIPPLSDVTIDLYLPGDTLASGSPHTFHESAHQTNYIAPGNRVGAPDLPGAGTRISWYFLRGVEVLSAQPAGAIVTLGDSITDGIQSTDDANNRWPDQLARRLIAAGRTPRMGVLNAGISGNNLLVDADPPSTSGASALSRFDRDVLARTGVTHVILLVGINDVFNANTLADELIAGYTELIGRARAAGLRIYGATLMPARLTGTPEANRQTVNQWIRTSGAFDAVIDFDQVMRDPNNPAALRPSYDSGDGVHPNDVGYAAMAEAIPLELLTSGVDFTPPPSETVDFDSPPPPGSQGSLNGLFEGIDFGAGQWAWEGSFNVNPTNHIYFADSTTVSRTFRFAVGPRVLDSISVFSMTPGTVTLADDASQTLTQEVTTGANQRVTTGWTRPSTTVTISFTNGWDLGVDDIAHSPAPSPPPSDTAPVRCNDQPSGTLPAGTTRATLSLTTNETATCRYSPTPGVAYSAMTATFTTTGGTTHSTAVSGLSDGESYRFDVRCEDAAGNANPDDFTIAFSVARASAAGLLVAYGFNEGSGVTAADASGSGRGATIAGATWAQGRYGSGLALDGVDDRVAGPSVTLGSAFTVMAWVLAPSHEAYETILTVGETRDLYVSGGVLSFYDGSVERAFGGVLATSVWQHVALVSDGTSLLAYVNGVAQGAGYAVSLPAVTAQLQVGAWMVPGENVDFFGGQIDEVRVYDRALSAAEIQSDMQTPIGP